MQAAVHEVLQERRLCRFEGCWKIAMSSVERRDEATARESLQQLFDDAFRPGIVNQPIVRNGGTQRTHARSELARLQYRGGDAHTAPVRETSTRSVFARI